MYFCLRSCGYTKTNLHQRTTQFRLRDIQFQNACGTLPLDTPTSRFLNLNVLVVTLFLDTKKNSVRIESISMELTRLLFGYPVVACARNNDADLDTPVCVHFDSRGSAEKSVTCT